MSKKDKEEALTVLSKGAVEGAEAFFGTICMPAAEQFGLLLRDRVNYWRAKNLIAISDKAQKILENSGKQGHHAHPRIMREVLEKGSLNDDETLQNVWAGLLSASCTADGDDENIIFLQIAEQLTANEALLFNHVYNNTNKSVTDDGFLHASEIVIKINEAMEIMGIKEKFKLHRELNHLSSLGLLYSSYKDDTGFVFNQRWYASSEQIELIPSDLGLYFYVRAQGSDNSPFDYFWKETYEYDWEQE